MTERWRKKLGDLDKQGPSDDVFDLAKEGPRHGDESPPGMRPSTRIATAVAAFAVFALAISVFAIPALRMQGTQAGSESIGLFPLWPSQTQDQLKQLQAGAESGSEAWALDPKLVAERFTHDVLGWTDATVGQEAQAMPVCGDLLGGYSSGSSSPPGDVPSAIAVNGRVPCLVPPTATAAPWDANLVTPSLGGRSEVPSGPDGANDGFIAFLAFPCGGGMSTAQCIEFGPEQIVVFQPLEQGPGHVWAVLQVRSDSIMLSTAASQNVRTGASIGATSQYQRGVATLGYASCGSSAASTDGRNTSVGFSMVLDTSPQASADCSGGQPGYVWAAQATIPLSDANHGVIDPIQDGGPADTILGLTAVPITMTFPDAATGEASPVSTQPSPTDVPLAYKQYKDPFGWTIDVPTEWHTRFVGPKSGGAGTYGAQFAGDTMSIQVSTQAAKLNAPQPGLTMPAQNDSSFPLNASSLLSDVEGGLGGQFYGDGLRYDVTVLSPSLPGPLSDSDQAILDRMISSITFQPWSPGDVRNDWAAIPTPTADVGWVHVEGGLYMLFRTTEGYRLYGSISCAGSPPSKTSTTSDGFAVLDCPDGSTWQMDASGSSGGSGQAATNDPPPEWPVATAHDGTLIAWILPGTFPQGTGGSSPSPSPTP